MTEWLKNMLEGGTETEKTTAKLFVLGKEHCLDVIINVYKNGWQTASEVARDLEIHTATAVRYLSDLHVLKLMKRRVRHSKPRKAFEYQLKKSKSKIEIEIDIDSLSREPQYKE